MSIAPAAACLLTQATERWPDRDRSSDGTLGDPAHAARTSDHNPAADGKVHAADLDHDPAHGCDAHYWANVIRLRAKAGLEPRLKYVISMRRIASARSNWEWVAYTGDNPHDKHAHFSVNDNPTEDSTAPWFIDATSGGFGTMTDAEITKLFADQSKQNDARFKALEASLAELHDQAQRHNKAARERDAALLAAIGKDAA